MYGKTVYGALSGALFTLFSTAAWSTDFYVDATLGSDAFSGKLDAPNGTDGPFKSLARLSAQLKPGDRGLLKCGEIWRESLTLKTAGTAASPVSILSYGSCTGANKPELRLSRVRGLVKVNGVWVGNHTAPIVMTLENGQIRPLARYPSADSPLAGYSASIAQFNLPDALKTYSASQLIGSVLSARVNPHDVEERVITELPAAGVAKINQIFKYSPAPGVPYYLEGKPWMLAKAGDWAWSNAARTEFVMHGDTKGLVEVSGEFDGVSLTSAHYTSLDGLKITHVGGRAVSIVSSQFVSLKNMDIRNVRKAFVYAQNSPNLEISGMNADTAQYDGISLVQSNDAVIRNNVLRNVGTLPNAKKSVAAIVMTNSSQAMIDGNTIENTGYAGIIFDIGSQVTRNVVMKACQVLDDCGYIYASGHGKNGASFGAVVRDNLLSDKGLTVAGAPQKLVAGIYLDDYSAGIVASNNYVEGIERGIYLHNTRDMDVYDNTVFDAKVRNMMVSERGALTTSVTQNNNIWGNTLVAPSSIPSVLVDSSLGEPDIAEVKGNHFVMTEHGPVLENWLGSSIARVLANLTNAPVDTLLVANQSACNTGSLYWTSAITKVDPASRPNWKLWSTKNDAQRLTDAPLHVHAGATGETIVSSPLFAEQAGKDHVLSLSGKFSGAQTRVPVVLRQSVSPYTNRAAVIYVYPDALGNFNLCTVFKPHTSESSARLDIHLKPTDNLMVDFVGLKEATYQPPAKRFASLINPGDTTALLACPFADTKSCGGARLLDQTPVQWPLPVAPRSGQVVYIP